MELLHHCWQSLSHSCWRNYNFQTWLFYLSVHFYPCLSQRVPHQRRSAGRVTQLRLYVPSSSSSDGTSLTSTWQRSPRGTGRLKLSVQMLVFLFFFPFKHLFVLFVCHCLPVISKTFTDRWPCLCIIHSPCPMTKGGCAVECGDPALKNQKLGERL